MADLYKGRLRLVKSFEDSMGRPVVIGSRVRFRGREYTIDSFIGNNGRVGTQQMTFNEPQHTDEIADELSIDLVV